MILPRFLLGFLREFLHKFVPWIVVRVSANLEPAGIIPHHSKDKKKNPCVSPVMSLEIPTTILAGTTS